MAEIRKCQWCGKEFSTCRDSITLGSWRADLCSEKCYQAKIIGLDLAAGNISLSEARDMFARIGVDPSTASGAIGLDTAVEPLINTEIERPEGTMIFKNKKKLL